MTQKRKKAAQLNKDYFQSLIATRASLGMLGIAWAGILIGGVITVITWGTGLDLGWNPPYDVATASVLFSLIFMVCSQLVMLVEPLRKFFYQHQRFSSIWQLVFVVVLMYQLVFLGFCMVINQDSQLLIYTSALTVPYILCASLFYLLCIIYNIFWLRSQLRKGMSEERRLKNYMAKPAVWGTGSLILIFGGTMLVRSLPSVLDGLFGLGLSILFIGAFSRLHIEYAYAAILKWRDKSYWEEYEAPEALTDKQKRKIIWVFVTLLEVVIVACIGHFNEELLKMSQLISIPIAILMIAIFADWIIRFVRWIRKK